MLLLIAKWKHVWDVMVDGDVGRPGLDMYTPSGLPSFCPSVYPSFGNISFLLSLIEEISSGQNWGKKANPILNYS